MPTKFEYGNPSVPLITKDKFVELAHEADQIIKNSGWANTVEDSGDIDEMCGALHPEGFYPLVMVDGPKGPNAEYTLTILCRFVPDYDDEIEVTPEGEKFAAAEIVVSPETFFGLNIGPVDDHFDWMGSIHPRKVWNEVLNQPSE